MEFELKVLPALPVYGPPAISFSESGRQLHSQGLVVEFVIADGSSFVGNFERGIWGLDYCGRHPDSRLALVIAGGNACVLDPFKKKIVGRINGAIFQLFDHESRQVVVLNQQDLAFVAIGTSGVLWQSQRISWDGFRSIKIAGSSLTGEAWDAVNDEWRPFVLNLETGKVDGAAY